MSARLQSTTTSVVRDLCESLRAHVNENELRDASTDRDRIKLVLQNSEAIREIQSTVLKQLSSDTNKSEKNKAQALRFKDEGNAAFGKGHYHESLSLYTKCIAWMPIADKKDLSIAYANRSAALFHLGEFVLAQQDIQWAFGLHYPKELHYKLHERSGRSFLRQGNGSEATRQLKLALSTLSVSSLDENKMGKITKTLEDLLKTSSRSKADQSSSYGLESAPGENPIPELAGGQSKMLRSASDKLSLHYTERDGRFVFANQDIQPGDTLIVQKPFVSSLSPELYHKQCYFCFQQTLAPIPCQYCVCVSYCSEKCYNQSRNLYHKYECRILGVLTKAGVSITCFMAIRLVFQTGLEKLSKWMEILERRDGGKDGKDEGANKGSTDSSSSSEVSRNPAELSPNEEYRADHISLLQLVTHSRRRGAEDIFHRTIMATYLLALVKTTGFLPSAPQNREEPSGTNLKESNGERKERHEVRSTKDMLETVLGCNHEDEVAVGTILLRSLQFLQFNAHELAAWDIGKSQSVFLGGGLFLTLALFNHSCNPAIVRYFVNDTVVVRAVRTIYRGEHVTENYGPLFTAHGREERRATLEKQYWFECQCISCREDWPTFDAMPLDSFRFRCRFCHSFLGKSDEEATMGLLLECRKCSRPTNILKSLKDIQASEGKYTKALELLEKGREQTALGILLQNISLFDSILLPPFRDYHLCQDAARKCFLTLGNKTYTTQTCSK